MGLIADYVEANRLRAGYGDIDPCMIVNSKYSKLRYQQIRNSLQEYGKYANDSAEKIQSRKSLEKQIYDLELVRAHYILSEKVILNIVNCGDYQLQVERSLRELIDQIRYAFSGICDIINELIIGLGDYYVYQQVVIEESLVRERILHIILSDFLGYIQNNLSLEAHEIKKIVSDCASIIKIIKEEDYAQTDKTVVQTYLLRHNRIEKAKYCCPNCKQPLYKEIQYCLNCNERIGKHE